MNKDYKLSGTGEMDKRREKAEEFFGAVFNAETRPYFVSDEATLYDIVAGDEEQVIDRCEAHYGVKLGKDDFEMPVWRLLDFLEKNRRR